MRKIILGTTFLALALGFLKITEAIEPEVNWYCSAPPFVGGEHVVVIPNVLIVQDMTGSMAFEVYHYFGEPYNPAKPYYGYADPYCNTYGRVTVSGKSYFRKGYGTYPGRKINYAFTTRIDIARKALTGGKGVAYNDKSRVLFQVPSSQSGFGGYTYYGIVTTDYTERPKGFIRTLADKNNDYIWDADAPHFALMTFSNSWPFYQRVKCPFGTSLNKFLDTLEKKTPDGSTNCSDAIFEAIHYLSYRQPHWSGDYGWSIDSVGTSTDPWYEVVGSDTISVSCRPTFCIVIGDGGSNNDDATISCSHLPWYSSPYDHTHFWDYDYDYDYAGGIDPFDDCDGPSPYHHRPGDDYAYYAHINDLRPDNDSLYGVPGRQAITFYTIYLFATGEDNNADSIFFRKIAKHGGFVDLDKDSTYEPDDSMEYDSKPPHGRPDNFFYADSGQALEAALRSIFLDIALITRVTSASAATISSAGVHGQGVAYQAQFYPKLVTSLDTLSWIGAAQSLWLDPFGNLREDTYADRKLHLKNDYVVEMFYDPVTASTKAQKWRDTSGTGFETLFVDMGVAQVESLKFIWNGANLLRSRSAGSRGIYTMTGSTWTGEVFKSTNNAIDEHLGIIDSSGKKCDSLIDYIRGLDYLGDRRYRRRTFQYLVWKLGDIIYSSPTVISEPMEAYHQIFGDTSYYAFWNHYKDRASIAYVGANDGMIHAFNGGIYHQLDDPDPYKIAELQYGPLNKLLGWEMWAFIPKNLLPHLRWLADTLYCHVYYNDLSPYAMDARIFLPPDDIHTDGWGTLLICGQRFGGGAIVIDTLDTLAASPYRSSYTAFDVTKYDTVPEVLWSFNDSTLGYTLCSPTMIKIDDHWFVLFGSGPQNLYAETWQNAYIYVLDSRTGQLLRKLQIPDSSTAITNIFGVDWGLDYTVDLVYFGTYDNAGGGKIYRIKTYSSIDPATWTMQQVINLNKPVTAEGSVALDDYGNLWLYFGTGRYYTSVDIAKQDTNYFVGIKDDTTAGTETSPAFYLSDLLDVTNVEVFKDSVTIYGTWDNLLAAVSNKDGWIVRLDSAPGERVVTPSTVLGGGVIFTSYIPRDTTGAVPQADLCITAGGTQGGNLWALFYMTGTAYRSPMLGEDLEGRFLTHTGIIGDIPSEPVMHIGMDKDKVFIQTSGGLIDYSTPLPYDPRGGVMLWRGR